MEYLQYSKGEFIAINPTSGRFKPYYKWNTFNTLWQKMVLFLIGRFKPYYKWNTFNTVVNH